MPLDYAIKTVSRQFTAGLASFIVGIPVCFGLAWILSFFKITLDGEPYLFFIVPFGGLFIIFGLVQSVTTTQFFQGLNSKEIFQKSLKYAWYAAIIVSAFDLFIWLFLILAEGVFFKIILVELLSLWILTYLLATIIGQIQSWRLQLENFNKRDHMMLIDDKGRLLFLKQGLLPYSEQVKNIWGIIFSGGLIIMSLCALTQTFARDGGGACLIFGLFSLMILGLMVRLVNLLSNPKINSIETLLKRKVRYRRGTYTLVCDKQELLANMQTERMLQTGQIYRFWFSERDKVVL